MIFTRDQFIPYSTDSGRVVANLEAAYGQLVDISQDYDALPVSMYWQTKENTDYLAVKQTSKDSGTTLGARSPEKERQFEAFKAEKAALGERIKTTNALITDRARQYRSLRLPAMSDGQGEILRALDLAGALRNDLMVVGTNAFAAYELFCGAKFPVGNEATEDFDLAWCRGTQVSLATIAPAQAAKTRPGLFQVLRGIDPSYTINKKKPYQAVNAASYEVELLAAPSTHPMPKNSAFDPMATLVEQEWLLHGQPVSCVVATQRHRACPLYVPDPRWMALHKLWLSQKPGRNAAKKPKDERQGHVLLDATRYFLADTYPMDLGFVLDLPDELRGVFNAWAQSRGFDPADPGSQN